MHSYVNNSFCDDEGVTSRTSFHPIRSDSLSSPMPPVDMISLSMVSVNAARSNEGSSVVVVSTHSVLHATHPTRDDGSNQTLLENYSRDTDQELPLMDPLPQACRKLFWTVFLVGGAFTLVLQLCTVGFTYLNSRTAFVHTRSDDDVDMPAITLCTETRYHLEAAVQNILDVFLKAPDELVFDNNLVQIDSDMEELYKNSIIYPRTYLQECKIAEYSCLEEGGEHHYWTDSLNQDEACSTLKPSMKVKQGHNMGIEIVIHSDVIQEEQDLHVYVHDYRLSLPTYYGKQFLYVSALTRTSEGTESLQVTMAAQELILSKGNEMCVADDDYDRNKKQDMCIDDYLVHLPTNCSLPWMSVSYQSCTYPSAAINISHALQTLTTDHCSLPWACRQWTYSQLQGNITVDDTATMTVAVELDVEQIQAYVKEDVEWPKTHISSSGISSKIFELIALIGASVAFFCGFSVLGFSNLIIDAIFPRGSSCESGSSWRPAARLLVFVLCWSGLIFQVCGLCYYFSYQTTVVQEEDGNLLAHDPVSVTVCTEEYNTTFADSFLNGDADLPSGYWSLMFMDPLTLLETCTFLGDTCDNHTDIKIITTYYHHQRCETISLEKEEVNPGTSLLLTLSSQRNVSLFIRPSVHDYLFDGRLDISFDVFKLINVHVTRETRLSECSDHQEECVIQCFKEEYMKKTPVCSLPGEQTTVLPACRSADQYNSSLMTFKKLLEGFEEKTCYCKPACSSEMYELKTITQQTAENNYEVHINLKPEHVTQKTEVRVYPILEFLLHIGGCLALITGTSVLYAFIKIANSLWLLYGKEGTAQRDTTNMLIALAVITANTVLIFVIISIAKHYNKKPVGTEIVMEESISSLPSFTLCGSNSSADTTSIWSYNNSTSLYLCTSPNQCEYVQPKSVYDILEHRERIDNSPVPNGLLTCSSFGYSCATPKGNSHTWETVTDLNNHCHTLHLHAESLTKPVRREVAIEMNQGFTLIAHDSEEAVTQYSAPSVGITVPYQQHQQYLVSLTMNHRFNHSGHSCSDHISYSRNQCLATCARRGLLDYMNCTLPWLGSHLTQLNLCFEPQDYLKQEVYDSMLDAEFFNSCQCPVSCDMLDVSIAPFSQAPATAAAITLLFDPVTVVRKQFWLYPISMLVINLGGGMALLTGVHLFGLFMDIDKIYCYLFSKV